MTEGTSAVVSHRVDRAREVLEDAKLLAAAGRWRSCVNRLYYACFYSVSALLASRGLSSSKHTGILSLFNVHFVKSGICSREVAEVYNDLFDNRQEGDYADFVTFSQGQVEPLVTKSELFVAAVIALIPQKP
jgi:uncharacterized protein (UPF0332 family)